MSSISASLVKELRDRTGIGMMDCKKALVESAGDVEQAIESLRKSSGLKAAKKAGRVASEGLISVKLSDDQKSAVLVEVNCETDFAARDENFKSFVDQVTAGVFESKETDVAKLMTGELGEARQALVQKIGENITVRRAVRVESDGLVGNYVHTNGKIGVLLETDGHNAEVAKDVAMHIAWANPLVLRPEDAPADVVAKEREIYTAQAQDSGKPPEIVEKIIEGRIRKFLAEISLVEQPFVKNSDQKVGELLKSCSVNVTSFTRFEVGEGIEVEEKDFAAEVAQLGET